MFQSVVGFIIVMWISNENIQIKTDKIQKKKVHPQSETKPIAVSHSPINTDEKVN
jgi:hypothetical protein